MLTKKVTLSPEKMSILLNIHYDNKSLNASSYLREIQQSDLTDVLGKTLNFNGLEHIKVLKEELSQLGVNDDIDTLPKLEHPYHLPLIVIYLFQDNTRDLTGIFRIHSAFKRELKEDGYIEDTETCALTPKAFLELQKIGKMMEIDYEKASVQQTTVELIAQGIHLVITLISIDCGLYVANKNSRALLNKGLITKDFRNTTTKGKKVLRYLYELRRSVLMKELREIEKMGED